MNTDTLEKRETPRRDVSPCDLETHVQARVGGQLLDFRIVVHDDGLVLQGRARTYYAKQLAQHAVMEATGMPIRANEIEVC
ncbi:MAG: hypothetical protein NZM31_02590 [Gemmatales bacterium]|nr:hypothetical protein [Gemmatales bacterium]MDW8385887.1 hypothetical protein [Gemmatales bacterium]